MQETFDRHDSHISGKLRSTRDRLGLALVVDETGRIRRIHYAVNVKSPCLTWREVYENERPVGCADVDVTRALKKSEDRGGKGWILLVDMYEADGRRPEEWERVYQLFAQTPKKTPVPLVPEDWLPESLLERRQSWKSKSKAQLVADLGPNPYKASTAADVALESSGKRSRKAKQETLSD